MRARRLPPPSSNRTSTTQIPTIRENTAGRKNPVTPTHGERETVPNYLRLARQMVPRSCFLLVKRLSFLETRRESSSPDDPDPATNQSKRPRLRHLAGLCFNAADRATQRRTNAVRYIDCGITPCSPRSYVALITGEQCRIISSGERRPTQQKGPCLAIRRRCRCLLFRPLTRQYFEAQERR
jgi:hypothetical protein